MATASAQPLFRTAAGKRRIAQLIYRDVFAGAPSPLLLMTPEFTIIDANEAYLKATMRGRDSLAGIDMFEAFPDNPELDEANGVANLTQSLLAARSTESRQAMPVQRYDVIDPKGVWRLRYWRPVNWPVLDDNRSVIALVHHVVDVTSDVLARQARESSDILIRRAQTVSEESRRIRDRTHRQIQWMIGALPRK